MLTKTLFKAFENFCIVVCLLSALGFTSYCFYEYSKDDDASSIHFKKYHKEEDSIYPSLTLCFADYLDSNAFGSNKSLMEDYKQFLNGMKWNEYLANLDYKKVTIDIRKYLVRSYITTMEAQHSTEDKVEKTVDADIGTLKDGCDIEDRQPCPTISLTEGVDSLHKCWTFRIPLTTYQTIIRLGLVLRKDIFTGSERPRRGKFKVAISYPGQYIRAKAIKTHWKEVEYPEFTMAFDIQNMVVLKK
jgi:hypothetical protein